MEETQAINGWVKLYHPISGGVQCTLPVPMDSLSTEQASGLFLSVERLLAAGFQITPVGLADGETREAVSHLGKRARIGQDGRITPILDVYCGGNWKTVHLYLNNDKEVDCFSEAFGLTLAALPLWEGDAAIERGKNSDRDARFLLPVTGVDVVYKPNPKWEGDDDHRHPKRLFVRWERRPNVTPITPGRLVQISDSVTPRVYADGNKVNGNKVEQQSFDRYLQVLKAAPASKAVLREWTSSNPLPEAI